MKKLKSILESLLFIADRPLAKKELAKITNFPLKEVEDVLEELIKEYNENERGIVILIKEDRIQMATHPENSSFVQEFVKQEIFSELTPASLETLSIIAYRGPIKQDELEQIRAVNCSIIIRNLLIKGLIDENETSGQKIYNLSFNFLRHLGIKKQEDLPEYEKFHHLPIQLIQES